MTIPVEQFNDLDRRYRETCKALNGLRIKNADYVREIGGLHEKLRIAKEQIAKLIFNEECK